MSSDWLWCGAAAPLLLLAACGGAAEGTALAGEAPPQSAELGSSVEPIVDGQTDRGDAAVLAIALVTSREQALCSGSLIAPNLVLTARHCVAAIADPRVVCGQSRFGDTFEPSDLWVSDAAQVGGGRFYPARQIEVPSSDGELCGSDIALLILDGQFQSDAVAPVAPGLDAPVESGEVFRAVGFGEAHAAGGPGVRREKSGLEVLCGPDDCGDPELVTSREWLGDQGVCDGDSGGPAFDAQQRVVGVASRASDDCTLSIYSAVASWKGWLLSVADQAYQQGNYPKPDWESEAAKAHDDSGCALASPGAAAGGPALPLLGLATLLAVARRRQRAPSAAALPAAHS